MGSPEGMLSNHEISARSQGDPKRVENLDEDLAAIAEGPDEWPEEPLEDPEPKKTKPRKKHWSEKVFPYNPERRTSLKLAGKAALIGAVVGGGNYAAEALGVKGERREKEIVSRILVDSRIEKFPIQKGMGFETFIHKTNWSDTYDNYYIKKAIIRLNKNSSEIDIHHLKQGDMVSVPVRQDLTE